MFKFPSQIAALTLAALTTPTAAVAGSCICFACAFDSKLENFVITSESMSPTMNTGKCALMRHIDPFKEAIKRGDVIGFLTPHKERVFVFRVIALSGDTIGLRDGQIILNGQPIPQTFLGADEITFPETAPFPRCETAARPGEICTRSKFREALTADISYEILDLGKTQGDDMVEMTVPPSHVFVMGDHRDNAADSRFGQEIGGIGVVPLENVLGVFEDI